MSIDFAAKLDDLRQVTPEQWLQRSSAVLPPWVAVLLVVVIAWQLARLTWMLVPGDEGLSVAPASAARVTGTLTPSGTPAVDVERIVAAHMFGEASAQAGTPPPELTQVDVETDLNLTLTATIAANDPERARAIIADTGGSQSVYSVDDTIQAGVKLHAIYVDQVTLNNRGKLERLNLPLAGDPGTGVTAQRPRRTTSTRATQPAVVQNNLREAIARNPAKLTNLIRPQPVFANGKQLGYRVYPGRQRQEFARLGLKPGDLVTEINGTPLDDPARGLDVFRSLADSTQVSVTVERSGSSQVLVLDTQNLNLDEGQDR